ncbi:MAG: hypothetical protein ACLFVG_06700 [Candidatus Aminicenantes bacterium]
MAWSKEEYEKMLDALMKEYEDRVKSSNFSRKKIDEDIEELKERKSTLFSKFSKDKFDKWEDEIKEELENIALKIEQLKKEKEEFEDVEKIETKDLIQTIDFLSDLSKQYEKMPEKQQSDLVRLAFKEIYCFNNVDDSLSKELSDRIWDKHPTSSIIHAVPGFIFVLSDTYDRLHEEGLIRRPEMNKKIVVKTITYGNSLNTPKQKVSL